MSDFGYMDAHIGWHTREDEQVERYMQQTSGQELSTEEWHRYIKPHLELELEVEAEVEAAEVLPIIEDLNTTPISHDSNICH